MPDVTLLVRGEPVRCSVARDGDDYVVRLGGQEHRVRLTPVDSGILVLTTGGRSYIVHTAEAEGRGMLHIDGTTLEYAVGHAEGSAADEAVRRARAGTAATDFTAPIPGLVTRVLVSEGDPVKPDQPLLIVEAMKMEHVVRATHAGTVRAVRVSAGDQVEGGAVVAEIGPPESTFGGTPLPRGRG